MGGEERGWNDRDDVIDSMERIVLTVAISTTCRNASFRSEKNTKVVVSEGDGNQICLLELRLPEGYPSVKHPLVDVCARDLDPTRKSALLAEIERVLKEWEGECCVFHLVEWIKEKKEEWFATSPSPRPPKVEVLSCLRSEGEDKNEGDATALVEPVLRAEKDAFIVWHTGEPLTDRKSTFQAHLTRVDSARAIPTAMEVLLSDRKIQSATHNVLAYRIELETGGFHSDSDDDGESAAGGRLLHLLNVVNAKNVLVVVSRWYGGTKLGPDRFKHIQSVARDLLMVHGFIHATKQRIQR